MRLSAGKSATASSSCPPRPHRPRNDGRDGMAGRDGERQPKVTSRHHAAATTGLNDWPAIGSRKMAKFEIRKRKRQRSRGPEATRVPCQLPLATGTGSCMGRQDHTHTFNEHSKIQALFVGL